MAPDDFKNALNQAHEAVKEQLSQTENVIASVAENAPDGIKSRLKSLFERKGKRVRATLLSLIAECSNKNVDTSRIAHASAGIELLHLASLVHDDIIDGTEIRRGQITAHKEWGTKIAVLIGDYVLSQAMQCVIGEESREIPTILATAADKLIAGEILELDNSGNTNLSLNLYKKIIDGKTAALIAAAARIGAILAGLDKNTVDSCEQMGSHFGIAFQIVDDLLDYGFGSENLDKAKFTDLGNGLITLPLLYYFDECTTQEHMHMEQLIVSANKPNVPEQIIQLLQEKCAFKKAKETANNHIEAALQIAHLLPGGAIANKIEQLILSMDSRGN